MPQHIHRSNDWGSNHVGELERMLKELGFGGDRVNGPDEVLEPMAIDARLEVDIGCETGRANIVSAFEPMDIDQETDVCIGDKKPEQIGSSILTSHYRYDNRKTNSSLDREAKITSDIERRPIHHSKSQFKKKIVHKRKLARVTSFSNRLIGYDPIGTFADNCEKTLPDWIALLRKATFPNDITSEDPRIITAFRAVDNVICGQGTDLLQRLAHVQLMRLFGSLKGIIKSDRDNGRIHREPYYRDASVAMDIYLSAQETQSNTKELRLKLKQGRKRFSKRWSDLAAPSPLFVLVYSDAAEAIVKDFKKADNLTLNMVATRILRMCPGQLMAICARLATAAETAVRLNDSFDMLPFSAAQIRRSIAA
ncbi:hypothetical protein F5Y03DRAFT_400513 [Xylaria venustula]|nr:hypothetical protein F5Y03DRAFT_400513 [Xylaria venustula]